MHLFDRLIHPFIFTINRKAYICYTKQGYKVRKGIGACILLLIWHACILLLIWHACILLLIWHACVLLLIWHACILLLNQIRKEDWISFMFAFTSFCSWAISWKTQKYDKKEIGSLSWPHLPLHTCVSGVANVLLTCC